MIIRLKSGFRKWSNIPFRVLAKLVAGVWSKQDIPVIINNFNRLDCLKEQIKWFETAGFKRIFILDNASSYPPLLKYYRRSKHWVIRLDKNVGHTALWNSHAFLLFKNRHYILTDPDVIPVEECPSHFCQYFKDLLKRYPHKGKVGCALKIDDLPDHYPLKDKVKSWEAQFWEKELEPQVYDAMVDTTLALYKPNAKGDAGLLPALRVGGKYQARHLPWYLDPDYPSDEELYYRKTASATASWTIALKENGA